MSAPERIRIEIAFDGPQILTVTLGTEAADALERALSKGNDDSYSFDADDGRYTVQVRRIVYVKRFARESRVGFGG